MQLDFSFRRTNTSPRLDALGCGNKTLLAWFYCGVIKNARDQFQPFAKVAFKIQFSDKSYSDKFVYRKIPIEHLGQLRVGSLCKNNRIIARAQFEEREFGVLHDQGGFWFDSFYSTAKKGFSPPYPQHIYPLQFPKDKNWMVCFKLNNGGKLTIPSLEYFTRCYGRSGKLRRYLTTLKWGEHGCLPSAFFNTIDQPEEPSKWKINLKKGFYNGDAVFLAHLKYDKYTQRVTKLISNEIETEFNNDGREIPIFPRIGPWHRGSAELLVRGIPFNNGKSFLGLQITGLSEPQGEDIERSRDNRNNAANPAGPEAAGDAWSGAPVRRPNPRPEIMDLTAYDPPDQGSVMFELEDPKVKILGQRRKVTSYQDEQAKYKGGKAGETGGNSTLSSGDPHGNSKGIDQASIHALEVVQPEMESEGALRDIWNAAQRLKTMYREVTRVEWYTLSKGFSENSEPQLIALRPYERDDFINGFPIPTKTRNWLYLDPDTKEKVRGLLVIRLMIKEKDIYIVEAQRRIKTTISNGLATIKEEPLRGMVFTLKSQDQLKKWVKFIRSEIRRVEGVVVNLTHHCPGEADVFKHTPAANEAVACWAALLNALKKAGIVFSEQ